MGTTYKYFENLASMTMEYRNKETRLFLKRLQYVENYNISIHLEIKLKERNSD